LTPGPLGEEKKREREIEKGSWLSLYNPDSRRKKRRERRERERKRD
jgi:hypothetical protein